MTIPETRIFRLGRGENDHCRSQCAKIVSASTVAKRAPTHRRGPPPKGKYWKRWRPFFAPAVNRFGSNSSGFSQSASWRWISQGQMETISPGATSSFPRRSGATA